MQQLRRYSVSCMLALVSLLPVAQAQTSFSIKGYGKGYKNGDKIYLLFRPEGASVSYADSTTVTNGAFRFTGNISDTTVAGIYRNTNPLYENTVPDAFSFYVEPGTIDIRSEDTLKNSIVSGTPANNDYTQLQQALKPFYTKLKSIRSTDDLTAEESKNTALVDSLIKKSIGVRIEMAPVQLDFIKKHPDSYVSLVTLNTLARNSSLLPDAEAVFPLLNEKLKARPIGKNVLRRINESKKISVGMMAKDFSQADASGKTINLADFRGKYILLDFWASWCLPCREENPNVLAVYNKYKNKGFAVLGVSIDDEKGKSAWLKAIKEDGLTWPQVSDLKGSNNEAARLYGITAIPANVLIDPAGKIIAKDLKRKDLRDKLEAIFGN